MRRHVLAIFIALTTLGITGSVYAQQSADEFTRNSNQVPDFHDQSGGWERQIGDDKAWTDENVGLMKMESHLNRQKDLIVDLYLRKDKSGVMQELFLRYGSKEVGRAAIKVGGKWYVGKAPLYDHGKKSPEYDIQGELFLGKDGKPIGVKITLETTEGSKELILLR